MFYNVEIKAKTSNSELIRKYLTEQGAFYNGMDHQVDTFFQIPVGNGRLKLREGNIENALIHYHRPNQAGPKTSEVTHFETSISAGLKEVLQKALGELVTVDKVRYIFFIQNVKFHLDEVKDLGSFVEIEAIDKDGSIGIKALDEQCRYYMQALGIQPNDLIDVAYADLLLNERQAPPGEPKQQD